MYTDGVNVFSSATAEPKLGYTDEAVIGRLKTHPEVKSCQLLARGFINVQFQEALGRNRLAAFKESTANYATISEKRLHQMCVT